MARITKYLPFIAMFAVQVGYAGLNILSKLALYSGMSPYVMITYRQIIATVALAPLAFFFERNNRITISAKILFQIFACSICGATLDQLLYVIGLQYTTSTIASALTNIIPAMTFILAILLRIETAEMRSNSGKAKIVGTSLCVGGAMLLTFFKGPLINIPSSGVHWLYAEKIMDRGNKALVVTSGTSKKEILGAIFVVGSCMAWSCWAIIQSKMSRAFSAPYTTSTIMCAMATVECLLISCILERDLNRWALGAGIRLISTLYIGLVGSGFAVFLTTWAIEKEGPLFVSMFSPMLLIIVAILGWAIFDEKLYVGSVLASVVIIFGLYLVIWGKSNDSNVEVSNSQTIDSEEVEEGANLDIEVTTEGEEGEEGEGEEGEEGEGEDCNQEIEDEMKKFKE